MQQLLRIDTSARLTGSHSRQLGDHFQNLWMKRNPGGNVIIRDIVKSPINHITQQTIDGFFTPEEALIPDHRDALQLSDELIAEIQASDTLLLTVPIYNFSVPSALKAWIDQVVRIGQTFSYDGEKFEGLVRAKNATVICVYGAAGYLDGEPFSAANHLEPYLRFLLRFLGIENVSIISLQSTTADPETIEVNTKTAQLEIENLING